MNKKIFDQRLRSIAHYQQEIYHFAEARKVTEETRESLIQSLIEFVPFKQGQIWTYGQRIFKVHLVKPEVSSYSNTIRWQLQVKYPDNFGGYSSDWKNLEIPLDEVETKCKLLIDVPENETT